MADKEIKNYPAYKKAINDICTGFSFVGAFGFSARLIEIESIDLRAEDLAQLVDAVDLALDIYSARSEARKRQTEVFEMVYPLSISSDATLPKEKNPYSMVGEVLPKFNNRGALTGEYGVTKARVLQLIYPVSGFIVKCLYNDPYFNTKLKIK